MRAVDPSGNTDATPASYDWTIAPSGPANTPIGAEVTVATGDATVTLLDVGAAGSTVTEPLVGTATLPLGYTAAAFHEVGSTAQYLDVGSVCLAYDPLAIAGAVRLLAAESGAWVDVTTAADAGTVCGEPGDLGAFAIAGATTAVVPETSILSGPRTRR